MAVFLMATAARRLRWWLDDHPGARFIVTSNEAELCMRDLDDLPHDAHRFVSRAVAQLLERDSWRYPGLSSAVLDMLDEVKAWEANGWRYDPEPDWLLDLARERRRGGKPGNQ